MEIPYSGTAQRPPILDGSNYSIWKVRMRVYIKSIDEKAWEKLQMHFEGSDSVCRTKRRILTTQFENLRMEESETIDDYERRLRKIENETIDIGDAISNERLRMRDYKKPGQKPKVLNAPAVGKPLRICGPEQNIIHSKSQNHFQKEGKTMSISKKFESVKCHECTGFGHFANECPTRLRKGMCASLSDDEGEEGTEQGEEETHNALSVLVLQKKHSIVTGVTTLGHNTDQKVLCLNASISGDSNQEAGEVELSWDNAQKMYEELYNDWILRNKTNSALTKENSDLKASVARLEVVLSKKDLELGKVKEELGRANATLAKYNPSKTKLDSILMMGKDDRAGLGFYNSKFEVGESSKTVFVKENSKSASVPIAIPKEKPIPLKAQAPVQEKKKQRKRRFVCHYCHKQGHIKPYCFKLRYDYMYWNSRQELSSVFPTLNQNTARSKNTEKKVWVPKAKSSCNVFYTSLKTNVAGHWYFDSGSSRHMTGLKKYLSDYVDQDKGKVTYGGGANGYIVGKGTLNVEGLPKLHNVLHVEGLNSNLISISQLCDDDLYVKFDKNVIRIRTDHGKEFENSLFDQFCEKEELQN
ncbi:uncharacterized protein [Henckelia pumila]|uniref:uncharacterized protein n=1 Tax=Henckelia pumila TaxID=405737 RepID=UPI003C6E7C76